MLGQPINLDHLMTRRYIDCRDVNYNCTILLPDYYQKGKLDSVAMLIKYWEQKCSHYSDPKIYHIKFLLSFTTPTFEEKNNKKSFFEEQILYRKMRMFGSPDQSFRKFSLYDIDTSHLHFIQSLAKEALTKELNPTEKVLVRLYLDTTMTANLRQLERKEYNNSKIQQEYFAFKDSIFRALQFGLGCSLSYFNPLGANKILGNQMALGVSMNWKKHKNLFSLVADFKLGASKQQYYTVHKDSLVASKQLNGIYSAAEYSRILVQKNKFELLSHLGFGIARIMPISLPEGSKDNTDKKIIRSPDLNFGFSFRYSATGFAFWGVQAQYHFLNFKNKGGTDISGNAFSLKLVLGILNNEAKRDFMQFLY